MLFEPIQIRQLTVKNRIVMPGFHLNYAQNGAITERLINFYRARAKGGAGLIMVGGAAVQASGVFAGWISLHEDGLIPGHQDLTAAVKSAGARIGLQLLHQGRYSAGFTENQDVAAPSAVRSRLTGFVPRELTRDQINQVVLDFGMAARRAREAGYDLVEISGSAGYLINQFLSPLTNLREDEYGGSLKNRMRFGLEVIREVRRQVRIDYPLSVRLGGQDYLTGGVTWPEMQLFAEQLEKVGVDLFNVTGGWHETAVPQLNGAVPAGAFAYLAGKIKSRVGVPVVASNRIASPQVAESILQEGKADLVSVARGLLADPEWPAKVQSGMKPIRKCIACMLCLDQIFQRKPVICAVNPACGCEQDEIIAATDKKRMLVIGAGPAGLEAACTLAARGHQVTVWEQRDVIGGQWTLAAMPPGKSDFLALLEYYEKMLAQLGVDLVLKRFAAKEDVLAFAADAVIIATGARPLSELPFPCQNAQVLHAWEVLAGKPVKGPEILVIGGGAVGCETALYLAEKGALDADTARFMLIHEVEPVEEIRRLLLSGSYKVTIVEQQKGLARDMNNASRWLLIKNLNLFGVGILDQTLVEQVKEDGVILRQQETRRTIKADTVVVATGAAAVNELYQSLAGEIRVYLLGDAQQPGKVHDAIHSAHHLAASL